MTNTPINLIQKWFASRNGSIAFTADASSHDEDAREE
jgi:hypothetical protein